MRNIRERIYITRAKICLSTRLCRKFSILYEKLLGKVEKERYETKRKAHNCQKNVKIIKYC